MPVSPGAGTHPPEVRERPSLPSAPVSPRPASSAAIVFWLMLAACILWVLSLPVFPSQDGPMHMYYVQIFGRLLHGSQQYAGFFTIRSRLSIYSFYYYLLLALSRLFPMVLADKLVACATIVLFTCGFRSLARALGPMGDLASLFSFSLILSWPLAMGFFSFCLSAGFGLFALAAWFRAARAVPSRPRHRRNLLVFLAFLGLAAISHPIPLLLVLALATIELLLRLFARRAPNTHPDLNLTARSRAIRVPLFTLILGYVTLLLVLQSTDRHRVAVNIAAQTTPFLDRLLYLGLLHSFALCCGHSVLSVIYRLALYALLAGAIGLTDRAWLSRAVSRRATGLWMAVSLLLAAALPFIPERMNGSAYFADRLVLFVWIAALAAFACLPQPSPGRARALIAAAALMLLILLAVGERAIRPIAHQVALMETLPLPSPPAPQGIGVPNTGTGRISNLTFTPGYWQMARYFRREDVILLNGPWLELPILPLAPGPQLLTRDLAIKAIEEPGHLTSLLPQIAATRLARQEQPLGFVLFTQLGAAPTSTPAAGFNGPVPPSLAAIPGPPWHCQETSLYTLCQPSRP